MDTLVISAATREFVSKNYMKPDWATGAVSPLDASFLCDLIMRERPKSLLEIGVASGTSTAFLSSVMSNYDGSAKLFSFDALTYFYANHSYSCGAFVKERFGEIPANVQLNLGISSIKLPMVAASQQQTYDFAFVDADHDHPWPCLDMISVIETTTPGSWVALHDVNLPFLHSKFPCYGPNYLLHVWAGEKLIQKRDDGGVANIGAIKLFSSKNKSFESLLNCLAITWQKQIKIEDIHAAAAIIAKTDTDLANEFLAMSKRMNGVSKRDREVQADLKLSGLNPWSRLNGSPWINGFVLHANRTDQAPVKVSLSNIRLTDCRRLVLPKVWRAPGSPAELLLKIEVSARDGARTLQNVIFSDDWAKALVVELPKGFEDSGAEVSLTVQMSSPSQKLNAAWLQFDPMYGA